MRCPIFRRPIIVGVFVNALLLSPIGCSQTQPATPRPTTTVVVAAGTAVTAEEPSKAPPPALTIDKLFDDSQPGACTNEVATDHTRNFRIRADAAPFAQAQVASFSIHRGGEAQAISSFDGVELWGIVTSDDLALRLQDFIPLQGFYAPSSWQTVGWRESRRGRLHVVAPLDIGYEFSGLPKIATDWVPCDQIGLDRKYKQTKLPDGRMASLPQGVPVKWATEPGGPIAFTATPKSNIPVSAGETSGSHTRVWTDGGTSGTLVGWIPTSSLGPKIPRGGSGGGFGGLGKRSRKHLPTTRCPVALDLLLPDPRAPRRYLQVGRLAAEVSFSQKASGSEVASDLAVVRVSGRFSLEKGVELLVTRASLAQCESLVPDTAAVPATK